MKAVDELIDELRNNIMKKDESQKSNKPDRKAWGNKVQESQELPRERMNSLMEDTVVENKDAFEYKQPNKIPDYTIAHNLDENNQNEEENKNESKLVEPSFKVTGEVKEEQKNSDMGSDCAYFSGPENAQKSNQVQNNNVK